uniref:Putative DNA polymerase n=1 Tax=viral metagenome TaxID=1070528 RepID=A0A6M3JA23_9ZZZZ
MHEDFISKRYIFVRATGPTDCKLAFVGEQPGRQEVFQRKPFVGPAGQELDRDMYDAKIIRAESYITNYIKDLDHPLKYYLNIPPKFSQSVTMSEDGKKYAEILAEELRGVTANVIVAVGAPALWILCNRRGIYSWRGSVIESTLLPGRKVIPIIHPATVIPPKNVYLNRHLITMDLMRAKTESEFPEIRRIERISRTKPSFLEVMTFLERVLKAGLQGMVIDYDIELTNMEVSCISFAIGPQLAICIPFIDSSGEYFTIEQESLIWLKIAEILEDNKITKRGQNLNFDVHFILRKYGIKATNLHDTMIAQKTLFPDYPVKLEFITTMYTDMPYYKGDGKFWLKGIGSFEQGWLYNCNDSLVCADAHPKQLRDLRRQGNEAAYDRQRKLIPILVYMQERGTRVDVEGMKKANKDAEDEIAELTYKLHEKCGYGLNPNSPDQVCDYFYNRKGLKPYKSKRSDGTYSDSVDETALKRISRKGFEEASLILSIRSTVKRRSTYLNLDKVDPDGRIRCSYNPSGTRYSRLSSSENIFGTGMNKQNWPHDLLRYLLPDEDYVYYSFDESQIENRIVGYVGEVAPMIAAFESGMDVHRLTAALIFSVPYENVTTEDGSCPIGGGKFSQRFWGKKANHAFNYDLGYKSFSLTYEVPETDGRWIYDRYHATYPGVKQNYHLMVRNQLLKNRTLTNLLGRKTLFLGEWGDKLFKEAYSCIPQGTTGDKINEDGLIYVYYNQDKFAPIELLEQVHDSIGFQIPLSVPWIEHARMLADIKASLEKPLKWKDTEFIVPADLTMGLNLCKEDGVEIKAKKFPSTIEKLAEKLEEEYNKLYNKGG